MSRKSGSRLIRPLLILLAAGAAPLVLALPGVAASAQDEPQMAPETREARTGREATEARLAPEEAGAAEAGLPPASRRGCTPRPPDMDAWYPFDGNGTDLILGNTAVPGGVAWSGAVVQQGARLTTPASVLTIAPGPVLNQGLGDFSIDFWLYVPRQWLPGPHPVRTLIEKRTNAGGYRGYSVYVYNSRLGFQLADGVHTNYGQPANSQPLTPGWNHVAVTVERDDPAGITFYRNGAVTATGDPTNRQGNLDNTAPTLIGRNAFGHGGPSTGAIFDELEFFDRELQGSEVQAIFQAGRAGKCRR